MHPSNYFFICSLIFSVVVGVGFCYVAPFLSDSWHYIPLRSEAVTLIWVVFFYWLPSWAWWACIIYLRKKLSIPRAFEIFACFFTFWLAFHLLQAVSTYMLGHPVAPSNMAFAISLPWSAIYYCISLVIDYKYQLKKDKQTHKASQLAVLRYQFNPHFLFNSLNTISAYIKSKPDHADKAITYLADILRYSLETSESGWVTISDEIETLNKYLAIESFRFGNKLSTDIDVAEDILTLSTPPLIFQPAVENVFKYGASDTAIKLKVKINKEGGRLFILVHDSGPGFPETIIGKKFDQNKGLRLLQDRVNLLPEGQLKLYNEDGANVLLSWKIND